MGQSSSDVAVEPHAPSGDAALAQARVEEAHKDSAAEQAPEASSAPEPPAPADEPPAELGDLRGGAAEQLVSAEEVESALREAAPPAEGGALDQRADTTQPADAPSADEGAENAANVPSAAVDDCGGESEPAAEKPAPKKVQFKISKPVPLAPESPEEAPPAAPPPAAAEPEPVVESPAPPAPRRRIAIPIPAFIAGIRWKRIYRAVDGVLEWCDLPFSRLQAPVKNMIGLVALMTIGMSLLAALAYPRLMPRRDAVVFLQERLKAMEERKKAPPPGEPEKEGGGHEAGEHASPPPAHH